MLTALFATFGFAGCINGSGTTDCNHELTVLKTGTDVHWTECECGYKTSEKQTHVLGSDATVVEPTLDTDGYKSGKCTVCGEEYVEIIPAINHNHEMVYTEAVAATCTENGNLEYWTCSVCEVLFKDELGDEKYENAQEVVVPAINHANERLESKVNPSCGVKGSETYYCPDCFREREVELDALTHDYKVIDEVTATCKNGGYVLEKCENCRNERKVNETSVVGHKETYTELVAPTCTSVGKGVYVCEWCKAEREVEIPMHDHVYEKDGAGVVVAPTCTEDGYTLHSCDDCDYTYVDNTVPNLGGHVMVVSQEECVKVTCESDGTEVKRCSNSGCQEVQRTTIPALNHKMVSPTCETKGYCQNEGCDKEEPALGHSYKFESKVEATCLERGYDVEKCSVCQDVIYTNKTELANCTEVYAVEKGATCTENGEGSYTCSVCKTVRTVVIPALGHSYKDEDAITTVEVTCIADGYTVYSCDNCTYSYKDNIVTSNGHIWELCEEECVEVTCISNGLKVEKCTTDGCNAVQKTEIESEGHNIISANCIEDGYCTKCSSYNEPKLGHDFSEVIEEQQPTHTEDGFVVYKCSHEGCQATDRKVPQGYEKKGHDELENQNEIIKVDGKYCTYKVRYWYDCSCGETIETFGDEYINHDYVGKITSEPTCVAGGVMTYTCKECQDGAVTYTENIEINPLAHKLDGGTTEGGVITYACTNQGCTYSETQVVVSEEGISSDAIKGSDKVSVGDTTISLDEATKGQLGENANVQLSAGTLSEEEKQNAIDKLTDEQKALLGDNSQIYNFEMSVDGEPLSEFDGKVTVRIPYNLGENEDPNNITVWYLNGETPELIEEVTYIVIDGQGYAEFSTAHFSYYTVAKMTPKEICAKYNHTYGDAKIFPATCMSGGYEMQVCKRCGHKNVYNETGALGHDYQEVVAETVNVSCTEDGYKKFECSRCQVSYDEKTNKLGHKWELLAEESLASTCTVAGKNVYGCANCEDRYEVAIKKVDHVWSVQAQDATCTELGSIIKSCQNCDAEVVNYIPALGHKVKNVVVAPTCTTKGYTAHYCSVCNEQFADTDFVDVTDHEWDREEPDCENDKLCKYCNKRAEENGKAYGHDYENGKCKHCSKPCEHNYEFSHEVESTCTGGGYNVYVCTKCNMSSYEYTSGEDGTGHNFQVTETVSATCQTFGYVVETCTACGFKQVTETNGITDHAYEDGKCIYCNKVLDVSKEYIDFIETFLNVKGLSITIENFEFYMYELNVDGVKEEMGNSKVELFELMLYIDENGEVQGAGCGEISIYNGPVQGYNSVFSAKAIISNGYLFIEVETDMGSVEVYQVKMDVDQLIELATQSAEEEYLDGMGIEQIMGMLQADEVLEILETVSVLFDEEEANKFVSSIVNILFTAEKNEKGYVYELDFDKLKALNENLAKFPVSVVVDTYFGEGSFKTLSDTVIEILGLEMSEIPDYVQSLGVDVERAVDAINNFCYFIGAPEEFNILDVVNNPELEGYDLITLISQGEMSLSDVASMVDMLTKQQIYVLFGATQEDIEMTAQMVEQMIMMFDGFVGITIETDLRGIITSVTVWADQLDMQVEERTSIYLTCSIKVAPNGKIEITWADIENSINDNIKLPEMEDMTDEYSIRQEEGWGYIDLFGNGKEYKYQSMILTSGRETAKLSEMTGIALMEDCGDWKYYSVLYLVEREVIGFEILYVEYYNEEFGRYEYKYFIRSVATGEMFELIMNQGENYPESDKPNYDETGKESYYPVEKPDYPKESETYEEEYTSKYKYSSGEIVIIGRDGSEIIITQEELMDVIGTYVKIFGSEDWTTESYTDSEEFYYNSVTGEFANDTQHNYVKDEEKSYQPSNCEDIGKNYYYCENCGEEYVQSYINGHDYEMKYVLSEGSQSCEDGYDMYEECLNCGDVGYYYEDWGRGHMSETEYVFDGETVSYENKCKCCGEKTGARDMFDIYTNEYLEIYEGRWGKPVEVKPGMGGNVSMEDLSGIKFVFVASQSGKYEFYSKNTGDFYTNVIIYNANFERINYYTEEYFERENFGMTFELVAGETYYILVRDHGYGKGGYGRFYFNRVATEEVDLSTYGCTCEGKLFIETIFGRNYANVECCCGLYYEERENWQNENCQEIVENTIVFYTENGEQEYLVGKFYTGKYYHQTEWKYENKYEEIFDENGNVIGYDDYSIEGEYCYSCGQWVRRNGRTYKYDQQGREIYYSYFNEYWSDELGEMYVEYSTENVYTYVTYGDREVRKILSEKRVEYDYWYLYEYEYTDNSCLVTRRYTNSYGEIDVKTYFDHEECEKWIEEESNQNGVEVELNGQRGIQYVDVFETYCEVCYASLSRRERVYVYMIDENGNEHEKRELLNATYYYELVAENAETSYWVKSSAGIYEYGWFTNDGANWYRYQISNVSEEYENGELSYWREERYDYSFGNYCEYIHYYSNSYGEQNENYGTNHLEERDQLRLSQGATNCEQGLDMYRVCYACGYEELWSERWTYSHEDINREVILLSEFGAVCGGYLELYTCPCGQRKRIEIYDACDLDYEYSESGNYLEGWHNYYDYFCAVTDPLCNFGYEYEYWYVYDAECNADRYERWTFNYVDGRRLVIESVQENYWRHDHTTNWFDEYELIEEDGYYVTVRVSGWKCDRCGFITKKETDKQYYTQLSYSEDGEEFYVEDTYWAKGLYVEEWFEGCNICGYCRERRETEEIALYNSNDQTWWVRVPSYERHVYYERWYNEKEEIELYERWSEKLYNYDGRCVNEPLVICSDSDGYYSEEYIEHNWDYDRYGFYDVTWNPYNSCTTDGYRITTCRWCGKTNESVVPAHGHSDGYWAEYELEPTCSQWGRRVVRCYNCDEYLRTVDVEPYTHTYDIWVGNDEEFGYDIWKCSLCGLEGKGYDGNVVLEDCGIVNDNFLIGYWVRNYFEYIVSVSLVNDNYVSEWGDNALLTELYAYDDGKYFYVSVDEVKALCQEYGFEFDQTMVRLSILPTKEGYYDPINGEYDYVYEITVDSHIAKEEGKEEGGAGDSATGNGVVVDEYTWREMCSEEAFSNYTLIQSGFVAYAETGEGYQQDATIKFANGQAYIDMYMNGKNVGSLLYEGDEAAQQKMSYEVVFFALLENYEQFKYNSTTGAYESYDEIEASFGMDGMDCIILLKDAKIVWGQNRKIAQISGQFTQIVYQGDMQIVLVCDNMTWNFSNFNRTVIESAEEGGDDYGYDENGEIVYGDENYPKEDEIVEVYPTVNGEGKENTYSNAY